MNLTLQVVVSALTSTVVSAVITVALKYRFDVKLAKVGQELQIVYDLTHDRIRQRHEVLPRVADQVYRVRNKVRQVLETYEAGVAPDASLLDPLREDILVLRDSLSTYRLLLEVEELFRLFHSYLGKAELFTTRVSNPKRHQVPDPGALYQQIDADHERIIMNLKRMIDSPPK